MKRNAVVPAKTTPVVRTGRNVPGIKSPRLKELLKYRVNIPDAIEVIWEPLYDFQDYPMAGQTVFTFFQNQIGVNGRTLSDTNLETSGQIPKGKSFLVTGLEVNFYQDPASVGSAAFPQLANVFDVYNVMSSRAHLVFRIGSKDYLRVAPLMKCPPDQKLYTHINQTTEVGAGVGVTYAAADGDPLELVDLRLESNQNFDVRVQFESAVPVTADARIGITLRGYLFRNSQ